MGKVIIMGCGNFYSMECWQDDNCLHSMVSGAYAINDRTSIIIKWTIQQTLENIKIGIDMICN